MEPEIRKEGIREVVVSTDPETGKLNITVDVDPEKLDEDTVEFLRKLSGKPASEVLEKLGAKNVENIKVRLDEEIIHDLDEKSKLLENIKRQHTGESEGGRKTD
ncbi:MAG: hypothetical protein GF416_01285 [Candidatus Altiarchaeales archaeon]|nr:hypothetical protein [Candidatus Altiarchaeales archaeon]MBD3415749.1 hypothetical protein [Candidatus Altiarchaeales archaeon]